jgi:predicted transcriptional regulator
MSRRSTQARSEAEQERDRRAISRLYLQGMYQADIAEKLGLSQPTVSRDIQLLIDEWKIERVYDINEAKARELAKVDNLELEYWEAWKRSLENAEKQVQKAVKVGKAQQRQEAQKTIEGQSGNPAFLRGIEWCINKRCEILGIDAPQKIEGPGDNGEIVLRILEHKE